MGLTVTVPLLCALICLIHTTQQYSFDRLNHDMMVSDGAVKSDDGMVSDGGMSSDRMVSDAWFDDILTDGWNGVPRGCGGKPADVYLVVDTAGHTSPAQVARRQRFLSDLSALFYFHEDTTRLGIVSYGHAPITTTPLGAIHSRAEAQTALQDVPRVGGSRRTAQALKYIRTTAFSSIVSRQEVAHVVILMTNGHSADNRQVAREASLLRKRGVYLYTVSSAGSSVDKGELSAIASRPLDQFVFASDAWNIVDSLIELLHIKECNYQVLPPLLGKEPLCVSRRPTEIAFALEHLGLGTPKARQILSFLQDLLAEVDPNSDIKAAILTSKDPIARYALTRQVDTIQLLEEKLGGVIFPDLSQLLRRARRTLARGAGAGKTKDVQKVLVVFMDESVQISKQTLAAARATRRGKVDTYVVYVGEEGAWRGELEKVASGEDHVIRVDSYKQLRAQATVLDTLSTVCRGL